MYDNQSSDRRSRGGSRHRRNRGGSRSQGGSRNGGGGSSSSYNSSSSAPTRAQAPRKLSFWQKLAAFFTGKPASPSRSSVSPSSASRGASRSASEPSQNGHRRFESAAPAPSRQQRKPELVEVSSPKLYVGNLSFDATEGDLFELFNGVGKVQNAEIVSNKYTHKSKGFAFVTMLTVDEARRAVTELHDKDFMGRKLVVSGAKTNDVRDGREQRQDSEREEQAAPDATAEEAEHETSAH